MITMLDYQTRTKEAADHKIDDSNKKMAYLAMRLTEHAGDMAGTVGLSLQIGPEDLRPDLRYDLADLQHDLGCTLFYVAELCNALGWNMGELARVSLSNIKGNLEQVPELDEEKKW